MRSEGRSSSKDADIPAPGPGVPDGDPPGLTGSVEVFDVANPTNRAVYELPVWFRNTGRVARYVNKTVSMKAGCPPPR
jgi:hypothetical protein